MTFMLSQFLTQFSNKFKFSFMMFRVMMTFLGILLYLTIDNTVYPHRLDQGTRAKVLVFIDSTISLLRESLFAVKILIHLSDLDSPLEKISGAQDVNDDGRTNRVRSVSFVVVNSMDKIIRNFEKPIPHGLDESDVAAIAECENHLKNADVMLTSLSTEVKNVLNVLAIGVNEPEIWQR